MITEEQRLFRRGKIGASSAGACLGHSPYSTPAQEFEIINGNLDGPKETTAMRVGSHMEAQILHEYNLLGFNAVPYEETIVHPDEPRLICHCDGKDHDRDVLVEIKNVGPNAKSSWALGPPPHVKIQACMQSMLDQTPRVDIVGYFGGNDLRIYDETYTDADWGQLYDALIDFLGYVDRGERPPLGKADLPLLDKMFQDDGRSVQATPAIESYARNLHKHKSRLKATKDQMGHMEEAEFEIKRFLGANSTLVSREGEVLYTWKAGKAKKVVDWEAVARNVFENGNFHNKEIKKYVDAHTTTKEASRRFLCKLKE